MASGLLNGFIPQYVKFDTFLMAENSLPSTRVQNRKALKTSTVKVNSIFLILFYLFGTILSAIGKVAKSMSLFISREIASAWAGITASPNSEEYKNIWGCWKFTDITTFARDYCDLLD